MENVSPPKFLASPIPPASSSPLDSESNKWTEILVANCHFGLSTFLAVLKDLCLHPERNSNLILRADGLPLKGIKDEEIPCYSTELGNASGEVDSPASKGNKMEVVEEIRVRLMPRQPNRDGKLDQRCLFFRTPRTIEHVMRHTANGSIEAGHHTQADEGVQAPEHENGLATPPIVSESQPPIRHQACVIYAPECSSRADQPFYYPPVRKLAYRYESLTRQEAEAAQTETLRAERENRREAKRRDRQRERAKMLTGIRAKIKAGVAVDVAQRALLDQGDEGGLYHDEGEDDGEAEVELDTPPFVGRISIAYLPWDDPPQPGRLEGVGRDERTAKPKKRSPLSGATGEGDLAPMEGAMGNASISQLSLHGSTAAEIEDARRAENDKLHRVCLNLLERVYRCGFGQMMGYQKRMNHDVVVPRDAFQDLYLKLKDRHRHLESRKPNPKARVAKDEDVKRHVHKSIHSGPSLPHDPLLPHSRRLASFTTSSPSLSASTSISPFDRLRSTGIVPEPGHSTDISDWGGQDVAIAAFLMLLWKDMYPPHIRGTSAAVTVSNGAANGHEYEEEREWDSWGRPEGGFVDLGCGNGLLVHVLTTEGYVGKGYELRARRTWPTYPPATRANLVELPIDFPSWFPHTIEAWSSGSWPGLQECAIKEGSFIIGNHADEITPWIPLLSLIPSTPVPFLSLPCCAHTLDALFTSVVFRPPQHPHMPPGGLEEGLEKGQSKYKAYIMHLGYQGLMCGWEWEKEGLRVPSTRGWGIVGRKRWTTTPKELQACRQWALEQVEGVRTRGAFQVRVKEGKDH